MPKPLGYIPQKKSIGLWIYFIKITPDIFRFVTLYLQSKSVLKINGIELINYGIICQIIEKSIKLNFEKHSNQLNAICRLQTFMGHKEKEAMINTFVHSNFNYGPAPGLFGTSVLKSPKIKLKKFMKGV